MLPSRKPNYANQLDYSWNDLRLKAEYVIHDARIIIEYTKAAIAYSQRLLDVQRKRAATPATQRWVKIAKSLNEDLE